MPLEMNKNVFITCAITGSGDTTAKSDKVPITPAEIAEAAIDAAKAGAAVVHCHVRNQTPGRHRVIQHCFEKSPTGFVAPIPTWC